MAVFNIPIDELRRVVPTLKKLGDSAVVSGLWAASADAERVSVLFVVELVEGGFYIVPMGVGEAA